MKSRLTCHPKSLRNFLAADKLDFPSEPLARRVLAESRKTLLLLEGELFDVNSRCPQVLVSHETLNFPRIPACFPGPEGPEIGPLAMIMQTIPVRNTCESCIFSQDVCSMLLRKGNDPLSLLNLRG